MKKKISWKKWMITVSAVMLSIGSLGMQTAKAEDETSIQKAPAAKEQELIDELIQQIQELYPDAYIAGAGETEEIAADLLELLDLPGTLFPEGTEYETVMQAYEECKVRGEKEGFTPILITVDDNILDMVQYYFEEGEEELQDALTVQMDPEMLKEYLETEYLSYMEEWDDTDTVKDVSVEGYKQYLSTPHTAPYINDEFYSILSYGEGTTDLLLLEVPTTNPWELPVYIPFSGFNDCPQPDILMHIYKYWYDNYGAEPVIFYGDGMEMYAPEEIQPEDALEAAKEQIAIRCDWVDTIIWLTPGLEEKFRSMPTSELIYLYAEYLQTSPVWYFWWD